MGYVADNLMKGEEIRYQTRLHWIIFARAVVLLLSGILFLAAIDGAGIVIGTLLLVWGGWSGLTALVSFATSEFAVTNRRVMIKTGFIRRDTVETLLAKLEGVQVRQGVTGRILGYGTIVTTGTGGGEGVYHNIAAPLEFRRKIQEQTAA